MSVLCVGHANRSVFIFVISVSVLCVGHANRSVFIFVISVSVLCVGHANWSVSFSLFQCLYCVWAMLIGLFHFRYFSVCIVCGPC